MKIKLLSILLICFGLMQLSSVVNAQDKLLEIDLGKDNRKLTNIFDLKSKGTLYLTRDEGHIYHAFLVNPENKIVWESNISQKEYNPECKLFAFSTDQYVYLIQPNCFLGFAPKFKINILQFDNTGKTKNYQNKDEQFKDVKDFFVAENNIYFVQQKQDKSYYLHKVNPSSLMLEKSHRLNLPGRGNIGWNFLGYDKAAYFYSLDFDYKEDGSLETQIVPVSLEGEPSESFSLSIKPSNEMYSWRSRSTSENQTIPKEQTYGTNYPLEIELDANNHFIYIYGFMKNKLQTNSDYINLNHQGFYVQRYNLDGNLLNKNSIVFKELMDKYSFIKEYTSGGMNIMLLTKPIDHSIELVLWNNVGFGRKVTAYNFDNKLKLQKVTHAKETMPQSDLLRAQADYPTIFYSALLFNKTYDPDIDDLVIKKLTEITAQNKSFNSSLYKLKYDEANSAVIEYLVKQRIIKIHSVKI